MEREPDIDAIDEGQPVALPAVDLRELAAVFAGGALGVIPRAALEESLTAAPGTWPWATFLVNIAAAALLGYVVAWLGTPRGAQANTIRARCTSARSRPPASAAR